MKSEVMLHVFYLFFLQLRDIAAGVATKEEPGPNGTRQPPETLIWAQLSIRMYTCPQAVPAPEESTCIQRLELRL